MIFVYSNGYVCLLQVNGLRYYKGASWDTVNELEDGELMLWYNTGQTKDTNITYKHKFISYHFANEERFSYAGS